MPQRAKIKLSLIEGVVSGILSGLIVGFLLVSATERGAVASESFQLIALSAKVIETGYDRASVTPADRLDEQRRQLDIRLWTLDGRLPDPIYECLARYVSQARRAATVVLGDPATARANAAQRASDLRHVVRRWRNWSAVQLYAITDPVAPLDRERLAPCFETS